MSYGARVTITGIYSEYLPIFNMSLIFPRFAPIVSIIENTTGFSFPPLQSPCFALPIRLRQVKEIGLACLFGIRSKSVYEMCLPVFYNYNKPFINQKNLTGKIVKMTGNIINIPERWGKVFCSDQMLTVNESPCVRNILVFR